MEIPDLAKCPFCDSADADVGVAERLLTPVYYGECPKCSTKGPRAAQLEGMGMLETISKAIERWNTREGKK